MQPRRRPTDPEYSPLVPQIDKLLKLASASERATAEKADDDEDPLRFAPNPSALVSKTADEEEKGGDGVYRPPKMLPTAMDYEVGGKDAKELRRNKEQRRRAGRSQLIKVRVVRHRSSRSSINACLPPVLCP